MMEKLRKKLIHISRGLLLCSIVGVLVQCGPRNEDDAAIESDFEGLLSITQNPNGTFTLIWPVAFSSEARYLLFKANKGEEFSFEKPFFSTLDTQYTTEVLLFQKEVCFIVRVSTDNLISDSNTKSLCTESTSVEDTGFYPLEDPAKNQGKLTLSWPSISLPGTKFSVFERYTKRGGELVEETYQDPLTTTVTTLYDAGITDRGSVRCFKLQVELDFEAAGVKAEDFNADKEVCTDAFYEEPFNFGGVDMLFMAYCDQTEALAANVANPMLIDTVEPDKPCVAYKREQWATPPSTGNSGIGIQWKHDKSNTSIVGYELYLGSGFDNFITCILPSASSEEIKTTFSECVIVEPDEDQWMRFGVFKPISVEVTYHFGIKAFDGYGRLDSNIKTLPIKAKGLAEDY